MIVNPLQGLGAELTEHFKQARLEKTALALGCAMARNYIHSDAGVKKWAAKSVELARALLAELDEQKEPT